MMDYEKAFDNYYPLIEKARAVQAHYKGIVCSDVVGELIKELIRADKTYGVKKE
jgi:hypothetical protein